MRAHTLFERNVDYIVKEREVSSLTHTPAVKFRVVAG
ncbi:hypothetical protein ACLK16_00505 [Escherichia coli]